MGYNSVAEKDSVQLPGQSTLRLLRLPDVQKLTGLKTTTIYKLIALPAAAGGGFPAPVKLGRASAWPEGEIVAWIEARMAARSAA